MKKSFVLVGVLIACLIALPFLAAQEKKCSDCHGPAYDGFIKAHTSADAVGAAKCKMCHLKLHASWEAGEHKGIECENCHGVTGKAHTTSKSPADIKKCSDCHTHER